MTERVIRKTLRVTLPGAPPCVVFLITVTTPLRKSRLGLSETPMTT